VFVKCKYSLGDEGRDLQAVGTDRCAQVKFDSGYSPTILVLPSIEAVN